MLLHAQSVAAVDPGRHWSPRCLCHDADISLLVVSSHDNDCDNPSEKATERIIRHGSILLNQRQSRIRLDDATDDEQGDCAHDPTLD